MKKITIAIADDQNLFRRGMVLLLSDFPEFEVTAQASNGKELLEALKHNAVDVILMDVEMPGMDGIETTRRVMASHPNVQILGLSLHEEEHFMLAMLEAGAKGYLQKDADPEEVKEAILTVMETGNYFNEKVSRALLKTWVSKTQPASNATEEPLTDRETEVLLLICQELTNAEIADKICLSTRTVEGYRKSLLEKTGARNTAGLVLYAVRRNMI